MRTFRPYEPDQILLLPPSLQDWLPEGHLARFVSDVVDELDLSAIYEEYEQGDGRGYPPYHPVMMTKLVVYGYCTGRFSSRQIERLTYEDVGFRCLAADQHPDHDTVAFFRERHLGALSGLFLQVLRLCREAGLVKLGHVAVDGTKVLANASKHKAMSYDRMEKDEKRLEEEIAKLLEQARQVDQEENERYGKGVRGDELPAELARRESRLVKIREAKRALEEGARQEAEAVNARIQEREEADRRAGRRRRGRKPKRRDVARARPEPKAQRNFTDPESRIMKDGSTKGFVQAYNAQVGVDEKTGVIVAADVVQESNDKKQLKPMLLQVKKNLGRLPKRSSADSGYFSGEAIEDEDLKKTDLYVATRRHKHNQKEPIEEVLPPDAEVSVTEQMRNKLRTQEGRAIYARRKCIVEPVIGNIKEVQRFRRFSLRGHRKVRGEFLLVCMAHDLLKLFRGKRTAAVPA